MKVRKGRKVRLDRGYEVVRVEVKKERKVRSDKKRDIKPTISIEVKDRIYELSYIMTYPVKDVCELMVRHAIGDSVVLGRVSRSFKRGIWFNETLYHGSSFNHGVGRGELGKSSRISFRVDGELYDKLGGLAYALDCTVSRACAVLLYESLIDREFIERCVVESELDVSREREVVVLYSKIRFR